MLEIIGIALALLASVILIRTARFTSQKNQGEPVPATTINTNEIATHLSEAIQCKTVSYQEPEQFDKHEFLKLHTHVEKTFPQVHTALTREVINECSLLYTWKGTDPAVNPILLMAHIDVVPVEPGTEEEWIYPPFEGTIADDHVWGRGSMDIKSGMLAILEAVEHLLKEGVTPVRTVYLAFGHDEEVGGLRGASQIAALLKSRSISLEYVLDEGGSVTEGVVPGVTAPVALVGIAEKGYLSLELSVETEGGHSSMPPQNTGAGILAKAILNLENHQMPEKIRGAVTQMLNSIGREMGIFRRIVFANMWLFGWLIKQQFRKSPKTHAMIHTSTAPTIVEGGTKENVLPRKLRAVVNFRILPGDTVEEVINHTRNVIADERVNIKPLKKGWEPSVVSDSRSPSFCALRKTIHQVFPDTVVAPYLVSGATDSRHYTGLTRNVYRFVPLRVTDEDLKRVHGVNERISLNDYKKSVIFYTQMIRNSAL